MEPLISPIKEHKPKRIESLDYVRGISVMLMIPVHTMMLYASATTWENSWLGTIIHFVERGTPMFLVVMGISFAFSSRNSTKDIALRGVKILAFGYLLNVARYVIPLYFDLIPHEIITLNNLAVGEGATYLYFFLLGDILQLAGLSLLFMALAKPLIDHKYLLLAITFLVVLLSKELSGYRVGFPFIDYICDLFWGANFNVYFSFFPWASFILIGLFFGKLYKESAHNIASTYRYMLLTGIGILAIGGGLCGYNYEYHFGDYYHMGPGGFFLLIGTNLLLVWLAQQFMTYLRPTVFRRFYAFCSRNVTPFYLLQWVIINLGLSLFGFAEQSATGVLIAMGSITAITLSLVFIIDQRAKIQIMAKQLKTQKVTLRNG